MNVTLDGQIEHARFGRKQLVDGSTERQSQQPAPAGHPSPEVVTVRLSDRRSRQERRYRRRSYILQNRIAPQPEPGPPGVSQRTILPGNRFIALAAAAEIIGPAGCTDMAPRKCVEPNLVHGYSKEASVVTVTVKLNVFT
ncbi:MAG: hypothetical protein IPM36_04555 [Lewinellaceae bacterium]|nr:hypothetical protein [Lewinellaceae bacterium]